MKRFTCESQKEKFSTDWIKICELEFWNSSTSARQLQLWITVRHDVLIIISIKSDPL